jgi:hypothetical protein
MFLRLLASFIVLLLASMPARSENLSDYFVSAKKFQEDGRRIFEHKTVQKAATFHKIRIDGKIHTVKLKHKSLLFEAKMKRTGLKTISGYRFYEMTYNAGSKKIKGEIFVKVSFVLKNDAQGNGTWAPRLQYYSMAYKPRSGNTKPRLLAVKCNDVIGS